MKKPTSANARLWSLNAELLKALETARSYIDACAPRDSEQRAFVLHDIDVAIALTKNSNYVGHFKLLADRAAHYERATNRLIHEKFAVKRSLQKLNRTAATLTRQTLEATRVLEGQG